MRPNHSGLRLWPGLLLVTVGAGLLARELGWLPPHVGVLDFWPLFIVLIGVSVLLRRGGLMSAILALAFIATGGALLAGNLGFLASSVTRLWPVLVILLGLAALFRRSPVPDEARTHEQPCADISDDTRIRRQYTCAGAELRIESQAWRGGEIGVTAGGVELDLRQAELDPEGAVLTLSVFMGGVEVRVPDTWQVVLDVVPFLGGADDSTLSAQGMASAPRLRIVGNVTLGGVNVSN